MNRLLQICLAQGGLLTTTSDLKVHLNEYLIQEKKKKSSFLSTPMLKCVL